MISHAAISSSITSKRAVAELPCGLPPVFFHRGQIQDHMPQIIEGLLDACDAFF